ncbi:MAG: AraC family transcriptional regulator [Bacteroidota bacterium]
MDKNARYIRNVKKIYQSREELENSLCDQQVLLFIHYQNGSTNEIYFDFELPYPERIKEPIALGYYNGIAGIIELKKSVFSEFTYRHHLNDKLSNLMTLHIIKELCNYGHKDKYFLELLAVTSIAHMLKNHAQYLENESARFEGFSMGKLKRLDEYIIKQIDQNITVDQLANVLGFSKSYFSKVFKATTGSSPYQYIIKHRMERARELLLTTDLSIIQIGFEVGIDNQSQFSEAFKRFHSLYPSEMRMLIEQRH